MPVNKVRRRGTYAPLSSRYAHDAAIIRAGERAELLYVRGLAFMADELSDGVIATEQLSRVAAGLSNPKGRAAKLVEVGLWELVEGGWRIRSWLGWNKSQSEILNDARKDSTRKGSNEVPPPPEPDPEGPPDPDEYESESDRNGHRNPDGIQSDSERNPNASYAGAGAGPHAGRRGRHAGQGRAGQGKAGQDPGSAQVGESRPSAHDRWAAVSATAHSPTAHRLVGTYAATCRRRPPHQVLGELAVQVDSLLTEGWPEHDVEQSLTAWGAKGMHPKALPSVAHEVVNGSPTRAAKPRPSTSDAAVAAVEALRSTGTDTPSHGLRAIPGGQP